MDLKYLTDAYIPKRILFRDEQLSIIRKVVDDGLKYPKSDNLLITGRSGSGKTATIKHILNETNDFFRYASALANKKAINILKTLSNTNLKSRSDIIKYIINIKLEDRKWRYYQFQYQKT